MPAYKEAAAHTIMPVFEGPTNSALVDLQEAKFLIVACLSVQRASFICLAIRTLRSCRFGNKIGKQGSGRICKTTYSVLPKTAIVEAIAGTFTDHLRRCVRDCCTDRPLTSGPPEGLHGAASAVYQMRLIVH